MTGFAIVIVALAVLMVWAISIYNGLVKNRQMLIEAFSGIDVQLKRRADLVPRLVETVKGYASHEKSLFENVTALRTQAKDSKTDNDPVHIKEREDIEQALSQNMADIIVTVENYPDLKASETFTKLMDDLVEIEDEIQLARRYYNGTVRDMNIKVQSFPSNIVAGAAGFREAVFFELESVTEKLPPEISFHKEGGSS